MIKVLCLGWLGAAALLAAVLRDAGLLVVAVVVLVAVVQVGAWLEAGRRQG